MDHIFHIILDFLFSAIDTHTNRISLNIVYIYRERIIINI